MKKNFAITIFITMLSLYTWGQCSNPYAGDDVDVCGCAVSLNVQNATTGSWAAYFEGSPVSVSYLPDNTATSIDVTVADFTEPLLHLDFVWTDDSGPCTDTVVVSFYRKPQPFAGLDDAVCGETYNLNGEISIEESENYTPSVNWGVSSYPSGHVADFNPYNSPEAGINVSGTGIWEFYIIERNSLLSSCYSTDTVQIEFVEIPVIYAGEDFDVCGNCVLLGQPYYQGYWSSNCLWPSIWQYEEVCVGEYGVCTFVYHEINSAITSSHTCEGNDSIDVTFWRKPTANILTEEQDTVVCGLHFSNLISGNSEIGVLGYWYNNNPATYYGDEFSDSTWVEVPHEGYYEFYWIEQTGPELIPGFCTDTAGPLRIHFLNTEPLFAGNDFSIAGYTSPLNAISNIDYPYSECIYLWENENANFLDSSSLETLAFVTAYGQYDFILTSSYVNMNTCTDSDTVRITFTNPNQHVLNSKDIAGFKIFPNPTTGMISLDCDFKIENVLITDLNGRIILQIESPDSQIDISTLEQGIYFVKVFTDKGESTTKIVKL